MQTKVERRGIVSFLLLTFGITYAIEAALIVAGFRVTELPALYGQYVIAAVMWVPALATALTVKLITREGFGVTSIRVGAPRPYHSAALVVPACFNAIHALTWLLGLGRPDLPLVDFRALMALAGTDTSTMPSPALVLPTLFLSSLFLLRRSTACLASGRSWVGADTCCRK